MTKFNSRCTAILRVTLRESVLACILLTALSSFDAVARPDCDATPDIPECGGNGGGSGGNSPTTIREGELYREASAPEVYVIQNGSKIWIPTPDALFAMGYHWGNVKVVPDGKLGAYPRFNIPSSSPTPGSLIFPPNGTSHFPLKGIPNAISVMSQGREIQIAEMRGWLRGISGEGQCNHEDDGADFQYLLELDTDWALSQGVDLHKILRVGNVAQIGLQQASSSPRKAVSLPLINVELNSWGWRSHYPPGANKPQDWTHQQENCPKTVPWPFDPDQGGTLLVPNGATRGPYVRMSGSLVTDSPHDVQHRPGTIFCRYFAICCADFWCSSGSPQAEWEGSVPDWAPRPGASSDVPDHPARWTEMHPPDLIEVLEQREPRVTVRGLALAARVAATPGPIFPSCEKQEFDLYPEASRPANTVAKYEELRAAYPEVHFPWGENADNGSWIQVLDDHIHMKAQVCGGALGGSPGRFKAIYRVWWGDPTPPTPRPACPRGKKCCGSERNGACDGQCQPENQECN